MSRIARVVAVGLPHHITQRGNDRARVFFSDDDRRFYLWTLLKYRRQYEVDIWAWCLMDNHVHVLAVPHRPDSLARCFGSVNLVYTQRVNKDRGRTGRLWQNRFFSCAVDSDSYLLPVVRYIERNPVRAGMANRAWDWPWSSARSHVLSETDPLLSGDSLLAGMLGNDYRSYLSEQPEDEMLRIRRETASGRPQGDTPFIARVESLTDRTLTRRRAGRPGKLTGEKQECLGSSKW